MKNKGKKIAFLIITIIITVISLLNIVKSSNKEETIVMQLSPQTSKQMMGYILKTKNDKVIIIDGGNAEDTQNLINKISENGSQVDYWFITHAHDDHAGAFVKIANDTNIEIKNVYISLNDYSWYETNEPDRKDFSKELIDTVEKSRIKDKVEEPKLNDKLKIDNIDVEILGVKNPEITENAGNEQSMVIKFDTGKTSLLILGDTGIKSSEKLLKNQREKLDSDIVQMSHHGQNGATEELYKAVSPKICLWPTPEWLWNNDAGDGYGTGPWKTLQTRKWMEGLNVKTHYVAKDGDAIIKIK